CLHGGVTRIISAGEVHMPGRPRGALGTRSLAIVTAQSWAQFRPSGVKVQGGGLLLQEGLTEDDFEEMATAGVRHLGEVGLGGYHDWEKVTEMVQWAKRAGMTVMMHIGGASIPGSDAIRAEHAMMVKPDVASHLNGGPTAPTLEDIEQIITKTDAALEIIQCGNVAIIPQIVALAKQHNALHRVIIGTDMPSGTGTIPLGMLRTISWVSALGDVPPQQVISMATGTTARLYDLPSGRIEAGLEADVVLMDAPVGTRAGDALETLAIGDTPGISAVVIDGQLVVRKSRNTPPAQRQIILEAQASHGAV
ncbi:MAG: amidohydrolase family protein, partial [Chloroflexota bacterium]